MLLFMSLSFKTTRYYQNLLDTLGSEHALCRTLVPTHDPLSVPGELDDPLGEEAHSPIPGLIHTYPDKVLLLATRTCAVHCQYCTRGRLVGKTTHPPEEESRIQHRWFQYLGAHHEVRDVLISGGDPLILSNDKLDSLFYSLRKHKHIRTIRLGSKIPIVMPQRMTPKLARILTKHRVWLQLHVIHPDELTLEVRKACDILSEAGVPMVSQTVLLQGINDDSNTLSNLFYGLLEYRVKPYYLFQCDPVIGSSRFRTSVKQGLQIMRELQGKVSGLALPHFAIDAPGGGGKITLLPNTPLCRKGDQLVFTNYQGKKVYYPDPNVNTKQRV